MRSERPANQSVAATIAREIGRTIPLVYGGGALGRAAALRWKGQVNGEPQVARLRVGDPAVATTS